MKKPLKFQQCYTIISECDCADESESNDDQITLDLIFLSKKEAQAYLQHQQADFPLLPSEGRYKVVTLQEAYETFCINIIQPTD